MPLCLALLFMMTAQAATVKQAFFVGLVFGVCFFVGGLFWVFQALSGYIGLPFVIAAVLTLLFSLLLALFPAMALAAGYYVSGGGGEVGNSSSGFFRVVALSAMWTLTEWLRGWLFTGFSWLSVGYSQIPHSPLAAFAPLAGVFGVSLALCLFAACLAAMLMLRRRAVVPSLVVILLLAVVAVVNPQWTRDTGDTLRVSLLQANIKQSLKWEKGRLLDSLQYYLEQTEAAAGQVVIMPETALPLVVDDLPDGYWDSLRAAAAARDGAVFAGVFLRDDDGGGLYNAAVVLRGGKDDGESSYGKRHLTPFGEFLPFEGLLKPLLAAADIPYFGLAAGKTNEPLPLPHDIYAGVSICYEDTFGDEWRRQLPRAHFLVNMTNDGWFDDSFMQRQHLQIAQTRALETGRWMARATNSGETAVVDWRGHVVAALPPLTRSELTHTIRLRQGATPYVIVGDAAVVTAALLLLVLAVIADGFVLRRRN